MNDSANFTEGVLLEKNGVKTFLHVGMELQFSFSDYDNEEDFLNDENAIVTNVIGKITKVTEEDLEILGNDGELYSFCLDEFDFMEKKLH